MGIEDKAKGLLEGKKKWIALGIAAVIIVIMLVAGVDVPFIGAE
jgi:hypothetical protein